MNAIILAGGYGTRLRPLTDAAPKPMLTVANRPILDYCVAQLYHYGIRDIVFTLGYRPEQIVEWAIGYTGISTHFSAENVPMGTLGGVKAAKEFLDDTFIVLSGDGISNINLNALLNRHLSSKALVTAAVTKCDNPQLYGVARLGGDGFIDGFIEKPHNIEESCHINCGAYAVSKSALDMVESEKCDFARDLFPALVKLRKLAYYEHDGYWQDVGDIKSYYDTNFDILKSMGGDVFGGAKEMGGGAFGSSDWANRASAASNTGWADEARNANRTSNTSRADVADSAGGKNKTSIAGRTNIADYADGARSADRIGNTNRANNASGAINASMANNIGGANGINKGGGFFKPVKNFNDDKYASKLIGNLTPSLVNASSKVRGYINECIIGGTAEISRGTSLDRCVVLDGAKVETRRHGCIIGDGFCVDVFDTMGQKEQSAAVAASGV